MKVLPEFNNISWDISKPFKTADTPHILNSKEANKVFLKGKKLKVGIDLFGTIIYERVYTGSIKGFVNAIERLNKRRISHVKKDNEIGLFYETPELVYKIISKVFDSSRRLSLAKKYESGKLTVNDLLIGYVYFEGIKKGKKRGVYHVIIGS